jgi:hypothetical protein
VRLTNAVARTEVNEHSSTGALKWFASAVGFVAVSYVAYVGFTWVRYGSRSRVNDSNSDLLLDGCLPQYDVAERHSIRVSAPADITFQAACEADLMESRIVRTIFRTRELMLGSEHTEQNRTIPLLTLMKSIGWGVLSEVPGREIVMGAVTQPWRADVVFEPLALDQFVSFSQPEYVKIAWTLRADESDPDHCVASTETRVLTTDQIARAKFRVYWTMFSPGIGLIRRVLLKQVKAEAERRTHNGR